jgi:hypothetical protein
MSYTFTEIDTFPIDETFNSIYQDSVEDINSGTIVFTDEADDEKKQHIISLLNGQNYSSMKNIIIAKDGTPCMYIHGKFQDNTYTWVVALVGKINNSKAWTWTSEFHEANKTWIQSLGGTKFALECVVGSRIDTYFTQATADGVCLGTLTETQTEALDDRTKVMTWEY